MTQTPRSGAIANRNPPTQPKEARILAERVAYLEGIVSQIVSSGPKKKGLNLIGQVESVGKAAASIAGGVAAATFTFYLLGFVIVNLYLLSFGARDFELTKPSYLAAGVTFIASVVAGGAPLLLLRFVKSNARLGRNVWRAVVLFACTYSIFTILIYLVDPFSVTGERIVADTLAAFARMRGAGPPATPIVGLWVIGELWVFLVVFVACMGFFVAAFSHAQKDGSRGEVYLRLGSGLFVSMFLVGIWGAEVYPHISPAFGGGRPVCVNLILDMENGGSEVAAVFGRPESTLIPATRLIDESDEHLLLRLDNDDTLRIPKGAALVVQYLREERGGWAPFASNGCE